MTKVGSCQVQVGWCHECLSLLVQSTDSDIHFTEALTRGLGIEYRTNDFTEALTRGLRSKYRTKDPLQEVDKYDFQENVFTAETLYIELKIAE